MASLQGNLQQISLPQVTIVFCGIEQADMMKVAFCPMHACGPTSLMTFISQITCCMHTNTDEVQSSSLQEALASIKLLLC